MPDSALAEDDLAPFGDRHGPGLMNNFAPLQQETKGVALRVLSGKVPADLNGVYLRNGPNPRFEPQGRYHPFDGDGMVHAARFEKGKVIYSNAWVRTDAFSAEGEAKGALFHSIRDTAKDRSDRRLKDSANTDLVAQAGRVLALWYLSGDAYEIDPVTLRTMGKCPGVLATGGAISAHAKVDEITDELIFFDYGVKAPYMHYGVIGPDRGLKHFTPIALPGPRLPHDMAITEHYSILHDLPLTYDERALALGRHKVRFDSSLPARLGVIGRYGPGESIRWFEFSPCFIYHVVNAWEEGDWVVQVGCRYMPALKPDGAIDELRTARNVAELVMIARLWEWRMNMATGETRERALDTERNVEFPTFNSRLSGRRTRYGYLVDHSETRTLQWFGVRKYDCFSGESLGSWSDDPAHSFYSEPWFAAADGAKAEDDGYVVAFQWNEKLGRETLDIFDAKELSRGPIAQLEVPLRIPSGFHACWMAADRMRS
ncbi:MAG TPA: carotenoid oxygenase family protein [Caulobacterales bacterium]|nr:carotenoid oxygenase family protein [Caulobacterales bacterium]